MPVKLNRQNKIKEILNSYKISNHDQMIKLLEREGIHITQATLSRDFAELGVVRTFVENEPRYTLNPNESGKQIDKLIGFEILSVHHNESMIIIRTLAGRAQGIAHYIDRLNKHEIMGTVGGDDTVLVIPSSVKYIDDIKKFINNKMNQT